jgi:iron complex transport system substrate-binding protein
MKVARFVFLFALIVLLAWGCSRTAPVVPQQALFSNNCQAIEPRTERCNRSRKIAVLSPYGLDLLLSLREQPAAYAGVSASRQPFTRPIEQIPYLGDRVTTQPINLGDRDQPSLEALALLKPDLILGERWQGEHGKGDLLRQIAPTVLLDADQGWQQNLRQVAQVIDRSNAVQTIMDARQKRIMEARQQLTAMIKAHPRVLLLASGDLASDFYAFGEERSVYTDLLEALGFRIVRLDNSWFNAADTTPLSLKILPQIETDLLIVIGWDKGDVENRPLDWRQIKQQWNQIAVLRALPVSQAGKVYFMDAHLTMVRGSLAETQILADLLQQLTHN